MIATTQIVIVGIKLVSDGSIINRYKNDPWLWDLKWKVGKFRLNKKPCSHANKTQEASAHSAENEAASLSDFTVHVKQNEQLNLTDYMEVILYTCTLHLCIGHLMYMQAYHTEVTLSMYALDLCIIHSMCTSKHCYQ